MKKQVPRQSWFPVSDWTYYWFRVWYTYFSSNSIMAPRLPERSTLCPSSRLGSLSPFSEGSSFCFPAPVLRPPYQRLSSSTVCAENAFATASCTNTTSGAYDDVPPKPNFATIKVRAATLRSAVRSTNATFFADEGDAIRFLDQSRSELPFDGGLRTSFAWSTTVHSLRNDRAGLSLDMANVSPLKASWRLSRKAELVLFVVCKSCFSC